MGSQCAAAQCWCAQLQRPKITCQLDKSPNDSCHSFRLLVGVAYITSLFRAASAAGCFRINRSSKSAGFLRIFEEESPAVCFQEWNWMNICISEGQTDVRVKRFSSKAASFFSPFEPCWTNDVAAHQVEPPSAFGFFPWFCPGLRWCLEPNSSTETSFLKGAKTQASANRRVQPFTKWWSTAQSWRFPCERWAPVSWRLKQMWVFNDSYMVLDDFSFKFHPTRQTMLRQFEVGWKWLDLQRWVEFCNACLKGRWCKDLKVGWCLLANQRGRMAESNSRKVHHLQIL